jgi:hypothetical protein
VTKIRPGDDSLNIKSSQLDDDIYLHREKAESKRSASWNLLVKALSSSKDAQDQKEAAQLMSCRGYVRKVTDGNGNNHLQSFVRSCNHRFCMRCAKRRVEETKIKLLNMSRHLRDIYDPAKHQYLWVTLTLDPNHKDVPTYSDEKLAFLRKKGTAFYNRKDVKSLVLGSYNKIETGTENNETDHHHIHALIVMDTALHQKAVRTIERNWVYGHTKVKVWKVQEETIEAACEMSKPTLSRYMGKLALSPTHVSEQKLLRTVRAYRGRRVEWSTGVIKKSISEGKDMSNNELEQDVLPSRMEDPEPVEPQGVDKLPDGNYSPLMLLRYITNNTQYKTYAKYMLEYYDWSLREMRRTRLDEYNNREYH